LLIDGVATGFLEIIEDLPLPDFDVMIVPLGGGSEAAAAAVTLHALRPEVEIVAVQPEKSPAAYESWKQKLVIAAPNQTLAGSPATGTAYETPFATYRDALSSFVLLSEDEIRDDHGGSKDARQAERPESRPANERLQCVVDRDSRGRHAGRFLGRFCYVTISHDATYYSECRDPIIFWEQPERLFLAVLADPCHHGGHLPTAAKNYPVPRCKRRRFPLSSRTNVSLFV
jgi:Pyridoxal-phosphate dependent enzyme